MKIMQEWTIKKDIAYVWTYTSKKASYENNLDSVQKMLGSFEIQKEESSSAGVRRIKAVLSGGPKDISTAEESPS